MFRTDEEARAISRGSTYQCLCFVMKDQKEERRIVVCIFMSVLYDLRTSLNFQVAWSVQA